jgi:hypothetical protein
MPILPWRTDADAFIFDNTWTFDATEQGTLAGIAGSVAPAAVAALVAIFPPLALDPVTLGILTVAASAAASSITATATLPTYGLCGGMAYTTTDYWLAKAELPGGGDFNDHPMRTAPSSGKVRDMIWKRLLTSLTAGGCLQQTIEWSLVLNQLPPALGGGGGTLLSWTTKEWPIIKATIDSGKPCPIGLLYTTRDIWYQHQILVYGYDIIPNGARLHVYDSYFPHKLGETADDPKKDYLTFDLSGPLLKATSPSDTFGGTLAGFFHTNYSPAAPPANLATSFGEFITFDGIMNFMTAYGSILPIANAAELTALGGVTTDPRKATISVPSPMPHPRDNALLRERSSAPVFLYEGGAPFWVPDPTQLTHFGGWSAVRVVPDNTIALFAGFPVNGTLIREFSDTHVFLCNNGALTPSQTPPTSVDVRPVPDTAVRARLLDKVSFGYSSIQVGGTSPGTVSLKLPFPGADTIVTLTTSQPAAATVPATITIPKGATSANFTLTSTGAAPTQGYAVQVIATVGDRSISNSLLLLPPVITQFILNPQTVTAGQSSTATLILSAPYAADLIVNLFSYSTFADVPATVTIPKNSTSVNFTVTTPALNYAFATAAVQLEASYANITANATLTVQSLVVAGIAKSITLFPDPVTSGGTTTATVTLAGAVNVPTNVSLTSQAPPPATIFTGPSPLITTMPSIITIPAGQTQGKFTIKTKSITAQATLRKATIVAIAVKEVTALLTLS